MEEVVLGCGPTSPSEVWADRINTATEDSYEAVIFMDSSRGEGG